MYFTVCNCYQSFSNFVISILIIDSLEYVLELQTNQYPHNWRPGSQAAKGWKICTDETFTISKWEREILARCKTSMGYISPRIIRQLSVRMLPQTQSKNIKLTEVEIYGRSLPAVNSLYQNLFITIQ